MDKDWRYDGFCLSQTRPLQKFGLCAPTTVRKIITQRIALSNILPYQPARKRRMIMYITYLSRNPLTT